LRSPEFWLTPGQTFLLSFELVFAQIPSTDIRIEVTLDPFLGIESVAKTAVRGLPLSFTTRRRSFAFRVPSGAPRKSLASLGSFRVMEDGKQRYQESMPGIDIVNRTLYFERLIVPQIFRRMRFIVEPIGGKHEPDAIVYHSLINPREKIDVESTLTSDYDMARWYEDTGKFTQYRYRRKLTRLLIVCQSDSISKDVIEALNSSSDPITMIEFADLRALKDEFEKTWDDSKTFARITAQGKLNLGNSLPTEQVFAPRGFHIRRSL
jgi:hypothetical protein